MLTLQELDHAISILSDVRSFLTKHPEALPKGKPQNIPKNFMGWTVNSSQSPYIRMSKCRGNKKAASIYIGRVWDEGKAARLIMAKQVEMAGCDPE